jgi:hypothetical protein
LQTIWSSFNWSPTLTSYKLFGAVSTGHQPKPLTNYLEQIQVVTNLNFLQTIWSSFNWSPTLTSYKLFGADSSGHQP